MSERCYWNWRIATFFTFVGPPLGGVVLTLVLFAGVLFQPDSRNAFGNQFLMLFILASTNIPFACLAGFVPALMTGLLMPVIWALSPATLRRNCVYRIITGGITGAGMMFIFILLLSLLLSLVFFRGVEALLYFRKAEVVPKIIWICLSLAAISTAICSAISGFWLNDVKSSKPAKRVRHKQRL